MTCRSIECPILTNQWPSMPHLGYNSTGCLFLLLNDQHESTIKRIKERGLGSCKIDQNLIWPTHVTCSYLMFLSEITISSWCFYTSCKLSHLWLCPNANNHVTWRVLHLRSHKTKEKILVSLICQKLKFGIIYCPHVLSNLYTRLIFHIF